MIRAEDFVECARRLGYRWYTGVPCSFLTPFISSAIADPALHYLAAANEGDALAAAAGAVLGGQRAVVMMQNSGLGNAVNPLASLTHVFRIPVLLIVTLRGDSRLHDEPQHTLMGRITGTLLENLSVPWEYFPTEPADVEPVLGRAVAHMAREQRPYAFVMRKDSVAPHEPPAAHGGPGVRRSYTEPDRLYVHAPADRHARHEALRHIMALTPERNTVVIATTGYTGRELCALADRPNQLYMVGSMGCASSLGLGLALVRPELRVVVIDGDGAALMRMGNLAAIGAYAPANLTHIVLDNEAHDSTGGQATVSPGISFARIAAACGYVYTAEGDDLALIETVLAEPSGGPRFLQLKIRCGTLPDLPRPGLSPEQVRARLMAHIGAASLDAVTVQTL